MITNAPAVFQALINDVLKDFLNRFVYVYLDDLLIFFPVPRGTPGSCLSRFAIAVGEQVIRCQNWKKM